MDARERTSAWVGQLQSELAPVAQASRLRLESLVKKGDPERWRARIEVESIEARLLQLMELGAEADAVPNDHALRQEIDRRILKLEAAVAYHSIMLDEIEGQLAQRGELRTIIWSNRMTAQLADLRDLFAGLRRE